jgi:hypothetical protein
VLGCCLEVGGTDVNVLERKRWLQRLQSCFPQSRSSMTPSPRMSMHALQCDCANDDVAAPQRTAELCKCMHTAAVAVPPRPFGGGYTAIHLAARPPPRHSYARRRGPARVHECIATTYRATVTSPLRIPSLHPDGVLTAVQRYY